MEYLINMQKLDLHTSIELPKDDYDMLKAKLSKTMTPIGVYIRAKILTYLNNMEENNE